VASIFPIPQVRQPLALPALAGPLKCSVRLDVLREPNGQPLRGELYHVIAFLGIDKKHGHRAHVRHLGSPPPRLAGVSQCENRRDRQTPRFIQHATQDTVTE